MEEEEPLDKPGIKLFGFPFAGTKESTQCGAIVVAAVNFRIIYP